MLPPLGLMTLASAPDTAVAPAANEDPQAGQFAANLLSFEQATTGASVQPRELDHNTADAAPSSSVLDTLPATSDLATEDPASVGVNQAMPMEDYALLPVDPEQADGLALPIALPPSGNRLPSVTQGRPLDLEAGQGPDDSVLGDPLETQTLVIDGSSAAIDSLATGPDELGLGLNGVDIARAVQAYAEFIEPKANPLNPSVDRSVAVPMLELQNVDVPTGFLTNANPSPSLEASSQTVLNPIASPTTELASSLITGRATSTNLFSGQPEAATPQRLSGLMPGDVAAQLGQALANQTNPFAKTEATPANGPTAAESVARSATELTSLPSTMISNSASRTSVPGISSELPGLSVQLPASAGVSISSARVGQGVRNAEVLTTSVARNERLTTLAGQPIDTTSTGTATVTASTQLRAALASMENRSSIESGASATAISPAPSAESVDASSPVTASATAARTANGAGLLPSGLTPMPPTARLDVADGMGGQWVGRLSQMIAQQQLTGQSLRIALSPAELGSVELTFSGSPDNWAVSLNAQQGHTRELLETHLDRIRAMLQDLGVSDAKVAMADRWTGGSASSGQQSADSNHARPEPNGGWQHSPAVQSTGTPSSVNAPQTPASGVDAYI